MLAVESASLADMQHISCFVHSLQLVVRDGLAALSSARGLLGKCSKLANLLHQSALFQSSYEQIMGSGKVVPSPNDTRWNSTFRQLQCISYSSIKGNFASQAYSLSIKLLSWI